MARDPARDLNLHGKAWLAFGIGPQRQPPALHRLEVPLSRARLALLTTGGFVPPGGEPFNTGRRGDASFREIDRGIEPGGLAIHHPHYDSAPAKLDINVLFPLPLCKELVAEGKLGELADRHYSFMGYVPLTRPLEKIYAPQVARRLKQQEVDAVLLTPA
ncbi:MAG: hypothetical protein JSU87_09920 [Gemmatimonadota bacterium]|nr:MAG: hypothetical protein JSU87_09920 [Gemmatimonadota bacterium]